jgi:subtilisin family serine protease
MRRAGWPRVALVLGAAIAAFGATACLPPPPPPPPPPDPQPCQSAGAASPEVGKNEPARAPSDQPIPPAEASAQAREVSATTEVRTKSGEIPLVTVEERNGRPEITSTPVGSPDEAAAVAEQKAGDGDLVAVDVDKPVRATTNDPRFNEQWSFTKVPFEAAWAATGTTGTNVTVAVVDTGVTASHQDLSGQVLSGHYFLHDNGGGAEFDGPGGTNDGSGHGTHVAGTVAAKSNNTTGISGAAPGVQVLPVQVLCSDGVGFTSDVADGIVWAVDNGAKVINLSLGGGADAGELSAIQYADSNNVVVTAAGGNDGQTDNAASYPAAYSGAPWNQGNVIAVAATTNANGHPAYGTTGTYLDLSAPGGVPTDACGSSSSTEVLSTWNDGGYCSIAGTSMATPHVSAAAALLRAANGSCSDSQVKSRLKTTATSLGNPTQFGAGLVNPLAAGVTC